MTNTTAKIALIERQAAIELRDKIILGLTVSGFDNDEGAAKLLQSQSAVIEGTILKVLKAMNENVNRVRASAVDADEGTYPVRYFPVKGGSLDKMSEPLAMFLESVGSYNFGESLSGVAALGPGKMQAQFGWDEENVFPLHVVDIECKSKHHDFEIPLMKTPGDSLLDKAYNMAVEEAYDVVTVFVGEYDTGDDGFGAGEAILNLWKGNKPKREPFLKKASDEGPVAIPGGVYFNPVAKDFYDADHKPMGNVFIAVWHQYAEHFPQAHLGTANVLPDDKLLVGFENGKAIYAPAVKETEAAEVKKIDILDPEVPPSTNE